MVLRGHLPDLPTEGCRTSRMDQIPQRGAIRLDFLNTSHSSFACSRWNHLTSTQTTQALIKETLLHRKNVSPQNVYETGQLYAAGALKAACIGLQCIGFNDALYKGLLLQAETCTKTGRWRGPTGGLGTGAVWGVSASANSGGTGPGGSGDDSKTTEAADT